MATYAGTRAAAEITTALLSVGAGAVVVKQATPGVMTIGPALAVAFAGILADPVQRKLGLHQRHLLRLIDALERSGKLSMKHRVLLPTILTWHDCSTCSIFWAAPIGSRKHRAAGSQDGSVSSREGR
jgi:hypothetical protein